MTLPARLRALVAAAIVSTILCAATFPFEVLRAGHAREWGEWAVGPCLLVIIAAGIAGALRPDVFRWRASFALSALALLVLAGRGYRQTHPAPAQPNPITEQLLRDTQPRVLVPADDASPR